MGSQLNGWTSGRGFPLPAGVVLLALFLGGCGLFDHKPKPTDEDDPRLSDREHTAPIIPDKSRKSIHVKNITYDIRGRSVAELNEEMQKNTPCTTDPLHHGTEKSVACTQSRFTLAVNDATPDKIEGLCRSESFRLKLKITTTLPSWTNTTDGDYGVLDAWEFFHKALTRHESGHANIAIRELIDFEQAVDDAFSERPEGACEEKQSIFSKLWKQTFEKIKTRNQEYDQRTAHGINNGTSFY